MVSMKSGLEGRNNISRERNSSWPRSCLNEVRPRRPEQCCHQRLQHVSACPVSMKSGLEGRNNRPVRDAHPHGPGEVSMKSGLEGRNNSDEPVYMRPSPAVSMKSGLEGRNNRSPDP